MKIQLINAKSILNKSGISSVGFCLNPYVGCQHSCKYCYAEFMKKYSGHREPWGQFVDIKINAAEVLDKQLRSKKNREGLIYLSSVTDPYQPIEREYKITRKCLQILNQHQQPFSIQTKSTLVLRDIDLIRENKNCEVGLTISTDNDYFRKIFEPETSSITERLKTLEFLKKNSIKTFAFIGPILPMNAKNLGKLLSGIIDKVYIDKMNYSYRVKHIYTTHHIQHALSDQYFNEIIPLLKQIFKSNHIKIL